MPYYVYSECNSTPIPPRGWKLQLLMYKTNMLVVLIVVVASVAVVEAVVVSVIRIAVIAVAPAVTSSNMIASSKGNLSDNICIRWQQQQQ